MRSEFRRLGNDNSSPAGHGGHGGQGGQGQGAEGAQIHQAFPVAEAGKSLQKVGTGGRATRNAGKKPCERPLLRTPEESERV